MKRAEELTRSVYTEVVYADGRVELGSCPVLRERELTVVSGGARLGQLTCTDTDLEELVLGWLYTQRLIDAAKEVKSIEIRNNHALVTLDGPDRAPTERRAVHKLPPAPDWSPEDVFALARRFREGMPLHRRTGAAHSCFLMRAGAVVYAAEDVGRFNAVDKAVGYALRQGIPLGECLLYTSGRVSATLVEKLAAAGVPVLVSKAIPTAQAVSGARRRGLTLLCRAWEDRFERFV